MDQEQKEELRESIWQKHKDEENQLIKQIEDAQRTLQKKYSEFEARVTHEEAQHKLQQLQKKYSEFERRVTLEVNLALQLPKPRPVKFVVQDTEITKSKVKCSICKTEGHTKRTCKLYS